MNLGLRSFCNHAPLHVRRHAALILAHESLLHCRLIKSVSDCYLDQHYGCRRVPAIHLLLEHPMSIVTHSLRSLRHMITSLAVFGATFVAW